MPTPMNGLLLEPKNPALEGPNGLIETLAPKEDGTLPQPAEKHQDLEGGDDTLSTIAQQTPAEAFIPNQPTPTSGAVVDAREPVDTITTIASSPDITTTIASKMEGELITGINDVAGVETVEEPAQ